MNIKDIRLHKLYKVFWGSIELHCVRQNMTHHRVHYDCFQIAKIIIKCKRWNVPTPTPSWGSPPVLQKAFRLPIFVSKVKKTYQWSQLGKIDPKRLSENGVNLKVMWERWQIVYKTICIAINQFKKNGDFTALVAAAKFDPFAKREAVTKNRYGHSFQNIASTINQRVLIS